jgi:acyl carrier protein
VNTLSTITEFAAKKFGREASTIDADVAFDQLGADSLGLLEFLFELEDHFNVVIPQEDALKAKNLRALAALIDHLVATASASPPG